MVHRGEIVQKAIKESGYSITKLATKLGRSRRWMYHVFQNPMLNLELVAQIGKIIQYDFSGEIKQLRNYSPEMIESMVKEAEPAYSGKVTEAEMWKNKYLELLERYNRLLIRTSYKNKPKA